MTSDLLLGDSAVTVRRIFVSAMNNAVYLLTARSSGDQILIDAADDPAAIDALLSEASRDSSGETRLRRILTTHAHWDHTRATAAVAEGTGASVSVGREDAVQLRTERGVVADDLLDDGDRVTVDGLELEVIALRGHTPGSLAFALTSVEPTLLFTGDSLFPGGVGNTGGDPKRFQQLFGDVTSRIFDRFDDAARVYPGHGDPTTLGSERPALPDWRARGW